MNYSLIMDASSYILKSRDENISVMLKKAFLKQAAKLPEDVSSVNISINASVAVRLFALLYMRALQFKLQPTDANRRLCKVVADEVCNIELQDSFADMYVSNLAMGMIVYTDIMCTALAEDEREKLVVKISQCRAWLSSARTKRLFGKRETEGGYAWNHTPCAAAAIILCVVWSKESLTEYSNTELSDIEFGLDRLGAYFRCGIREGGIPYEGFFYCGAVFRLLGLFDILVQKDADIANKYKALRALYSTKLEGILDWYLSCSLVRPNSLISYNHSLYDANPALTGMLPFFRASYPRKAGRLWQKLKHNGSAIFPAESRRDWGDDTLHEALLFLSVDEAAQNEKLPGTIISETEGYCILVSDETDDRLFVKANKLLIGPHNQSDIGHFTWVCNGIPLLIDAGPGQKVRISNRAWARHSRGTYRSEGNRASSYGHNSILINGKGQCPSGDGKGVQGRISYVRKKDRFWLLGTDMTDAYNAESYNTVIEARRDFLFTDSLLIVYDRIETDASCENLFERRLHVANANDIQELEGSGRLLVSTGEADYILSTFTGSEPLRHESVRENMQFPFRSRTVLKHFVNECALSLYTVLVPAGHGKTSFKIDAVYDERANDGLALEISCKAGGQQRVYLCDESQEMTVLY